jgi:type VI secretion system protein ImpM
MLGLWMPSVDRAGRLFPLTFARPLATPAESLARTAAAWLDHAEAAGLAALDEELGPAELGARLAAPSSGEPSPVPQQCGAPGSGTVWWTAGAPLVPAGLQLLPGLPDGACFARMLDAGAAGDAARDG